MAEVISVSLNKDQKEFLNQLGLSPSAILQQAITEMQKNALVSESRVKELTNKIMALQELIRRQGTFIDKKGLNNEWLNELGA